MPGPQTGVTHYYAQLGLPDKGRAIKGLVVCNSWDIEPQDLLNGLALGCYPNRKKTFYFYFFSIKYRGERDQWSEIKTSESTRFPDLCIHFGLTLLKSLSHTESQIIKPMQYQPKTSRPQEHQKNEICTVETKQIFQFPDKRTYFKKC